MNIASKRLPGMLMLLVLLAGVQACGSPEQRASRKSPPEQVRVSVVRESDQAGVEEVAGTVQSKQRATLSAKLVARVEQVNAVLGQQVRSGEVLVKLDAADIKAKLDQALAVHRQADAELRRFTNLLAQNAVTKQDFDGVQAKEAVARAAVSEAQTMLGYAAIAAPFAGVVTAKTVEVGDLAAPGKPLLEIASPGDLRFDAEVPETLISFLKVGNEAVVRIDQKRVRGRIAEMNAAADPVSRTVLVKVDLGQNGGLFPGQFGRLAVNAGGAKGIVVPVSAVVHKGQIESVFVVKDHIAFLRLVRTGKSLGSIVEILSGLDAGETIVTDNPQKLRDQNPVEILGEGAK